VENYKPMTIDRIPKSENQYIEFKSEKVKAMVLAEEIIAFANSEGGEIWLGIEDNGNVSGLSRSFEEDVMNICRTSCIPPIVPEYESFNIEGKTVGRISIPKGEDKPYYTVRNKYFIRVGSTKRIASREEMLRLFEASGAIHYDLVELDKAKISDLDMGQVAEYFTRYHISFLEESEEERQRLMLHADILGQNNKPTVAGLLIFGLSPERIFPASGISFAHFSGRDIVEKLIDKKNIFGKLPLQVENCLAAIKANLLTGSTLRGAKRVNVPSYPDTVFRELIVNACVHRNYSIRGSNIRIFLFQDRMEFISPGRLPNTVNIDKLPVGTSYARNPILVRFMENLGYVDKLGRGLPMVCRAAKKLGTNVEFQESGDEFRVTLPLKH
jgi:ATP-dependent DNA helicase RecG